MVFSGHKKTRSKAGHWLVVLLKSVVAGDPKKQHHKGRGDATGQQTVPADSPDEQSAHDHAGNDE
jgi:hypothetical protein